MHAPASRFVRASWATVLGKVGTFHLVVRLPRFTAPSVNCHRTTGDKKATPDARNSPYDVRAAICRLPPSGRPSVTFFHLQNGRLATNTLSHPNTATSRVRVLGEAAEPYQAWFRHSCRGRLGTSCIEPCPTPPGHGDRPAARHAQLTTDNHPVC